MLQAHVFCDALEGQARQCGVAARAAAGDAQLLGVRQLLLCQVRGGVGAVVDVCMKALQGLHQPSNL